MTAMLYGQLPVTPPPSGALCPECDGYRFTAVYHADNDGTACYTQTSCRRCHGRGWISPGQELADWIDAQFAAMRARLRCKGVDTATAASIVEDLQLELEQDALDDRHADEESEGVA